MWGLLLQTPKDRKGNKAKYFAQKSRLCYNVILACCCLFSLLLVYLCHLVWQASGPKHRVKRGLEASSPKCAPRFPPASVVLQEGPSRFRLNRVNRGPHSTPSPWGHRVLNSSGDVCLHLERDGGGLSLRSNQPAALWTRHCQYKPIPICSGLITAVTWTYWQQIIKSVTNICINFDIHPASHRYTFAGYAKALMQIIL